MSLRNGDLTDEERVWIIELENAIKNTKENFGQLNDFDIATHAIICKNHPEKALNRLRRLKLFKEAHNIRDDITVFEAIQIVRKAFDARNFLQAMGKDSFNRWVIFLCMKSLSNLPTADDERAAALYYLLHAIQPDLDAARFGTVIVADCKGLAHADIPFRVGLGLFKDTYQIKVKDFVCLHAPSRFSAVYAMCWPFLSRKLRRVMVLDCTPDKARKHFEPRLLAPSLGGTQNAAEIMDSVEDNLKTRFNNQETFHLK